MHLHLRTLKHGSMNLVDALISFHGVSKFAMINTFLDEKCIL